MENPETSRQKGRLIIDSNGKSKGTDINAKDGEGKTPLQSVREFVFISDAMLEWLEANGAE